MKIASLKIKAKKNIYIILFIILAMFSLVASYCLQNDFLWLSNLLLNSGVGILLGVVITLYIRKKDNRISKRQEIYREVFALRDFVDSIIDKIFGLIESENKKAFHLKFSLILNSIPYVPNIKKSDNNLYDDIQAFAEKVSNTNEKIDFEEALSFIDERNRLIEKLNEFLKNDSEKI